MPLQNLVIAGLPNPIRAAVTEITAGSEGATMTGSNLKNIEPSVFARLTSIFPHLSYWPVNFNNLTPVQAIALPNHTLIPGDTIRAVGVNGGSLPPVRSETLPPTAYVSNFNWSGAITSIDEHPSSPDGSFAQPAGAGPGTALIAFGTPASTPAAGSGLQCFVMWVQANNEPANAIDYPLVHAWLYEGGVERQDLGIKVVSSTTGQALLFPWDASLLQTADGSAVEIRLMLIDAAAGNFPKLDSVAWECLYQSDVDSADLDTGFDTIMGAEHDDDFGDTALQQVGDPPPLWWRLFQTPTNLTQLRIEVRSDGAGFFENFQTTPPRPAITTIDAGVLIAGPIVTTPYRFAPGTNLRYNPKLVGSDAVSGANRQVLQHNKRSATLQLPNLPNTLAHKMLARIDAKQTVPFLVILEPEITDPTVRSNSTFYATATEAGGLVWEEFGEADGERTRSLSYTFTERF